MQTFQKICTLKHDSTMTSQVNELLAKGRGLDFLKCFEDMSLRDASVICRMSFSTIRYFKGKVGLDNWPYHHLKGESQEKWEKIKVHRENMLRVIARSHAKNRFGHN